MILRWNVLCFHDETEWNFKNVFLTKTDYLTSEASENVYDFVYLRTVFLWSCENWDLKISTRVQKFRRSKVHEKNISRELALNYWLMINMMMMMNCFCGMVDRRKVFSLISSRDHCQRSSPSRISDMPRAGYEPAQNLSSGAVEWSCAVVITTTPRRHIFEN